MMHSPHQKHTTTTTTTGTSTSSITSSKNNNTAAIHHNHSTDNNTMIYHISSSPKLPLVSSSSSRFLPVSSSSSSSNRGVSLSSILYYFKYLSTILMVTAFIVATVIIPHQQRQLFASIHMEGQHQPPHQHQHHTAPVQQTLEDSVLIRPTTKMTTPSNIIYNSNSILPTTNDQQHPIPVLVGTTTRETATVSTGSSTTVTADDTTTETTKPSSLRLRPDFIITPIVVDRTTAIDTTTTKSVSTASASILDTNPTTTSDRLADINEQDNDDTKQVSVTISESDNIATVSSPKSLGHVVLNDNEIAITPKVQPENFGGIKPRPFRSWPDGSLLPCYPPMKDWGTEKVQTSPSRRGFLYVKPYKTGSSTTSGVNIRMARNVAKRRPHLNITLCDARFDHGPTYYPGFSLYRERLWNDSILWSIIRDPTTRAISQFFHMEVSRKKLEPTDANLIGFLRQNRKDFMQDYYYRALYTKARFDRESMSPIKAANQILRTYNFIGITERLDESFVVLMMILRLKMADILYLSAKTKGGYDDAGGRDQKRICTYIWPSFVTPGVNAFLNSTEWRETIRYDRLLYQAVNRSLDMTIDALGRHTFNDQLQKYRHAQQLANEKCLPTTVFPCDSGGTYHTSTDCLWNDSGCGATCLDEIATELNLW